MTRPDYSKDNYCIVCDLVFPKDITRCGDCKRILRTRSRNTKSTKSGYKAVSQKQAIKDRLNYYLDRGMTNKLKIFTKVVDDLNVPRPTVRRIARELRSEFMHRIEVLQSDYTKIGSHLN